MTTPLLPVPALRPSATAYERVARGPQSAVTPTASSTATARPPSVGELLSLSRDTSDGRVQATGPEGQAVTLWSDEAAAEALASESLGADLQPGDVLMVRVLATSPQLTLARVGPAWTTSGSVPLLRPDWPEPSPHRFWVAAMQPDQAAIMRMAWAAPDAPTLAAHWQIAVMAHLNQFGHEALAPLPAASLERWLLPIFAWSGLPMTLSLLPPRRRPADARRRARLLDYGVRLNGMLPGLGLVEVQVRLLADGAVLIIIAPDEPTLHTLHQAQPQVTRAVHRAGLRLLRCHWLVRAPGAPSPMFGPDDASAHAPPLALPIANEVVPNPVFRVAAEVVVALGALAPRGGSPVLSPASR